MSNFTVTSGVTSSGLSVNSGETAEVQSGGTANNTTVNGGFFTIDSGGVASGTTFGSGGGGQIVQGTASNTLVTAFGADLISGGLSISAIISSSGEQTVGFNGGSGTAIGTVVSNGGDVFVSSGGILSGATVSGGGQVFVQGGLASGTTISSGGFEYVSSGGVTSGTVVSSLGELDVSAGGIASGTSVGDGGEAFVFAGGLAVGTTLSGNAELDVFGSGIGTVIGSGGIEFAGSFGGASGTVIGTVVNSGGIEYVSRGIAIGTVIANGGVQNVQNSGLASGTIVSGGGSEVVSSGGTAYGTVVSAGGQLEILDGAVVDGGTLQSGATLVLRDGLAIVTTNGGATLDVLDGGAQFGMVVGTITNGGATIDVAAANATLIFSGDNTFDNAAINLGNTGVTTYISATDPTFSGSVLHFGANAVVNHVAGTAFFLDDDNNGVAIILDSGGTINAVASAGTLYLDNVVGSLNEFTNNGTIAVRNGDQVFIRPGNFTNFSNGVLTGGTYDIGSGIVLGDTFFGSVIELGTDQFVTEIDSATVVLGGDGAQLQALDSASPGLETTLTQSLNTIGAGASLYLLDDFSAGFNASTLTVNGTLSVQGTAYVDFNNLTVASDDAFVQLGGNTRVFGDISMLGGEAIALDPTMGTFVEVFGNISESGGSRGLVVAGGGMVQLDGTNTFTGGIRVNDSGTTLFISQDANLGDVVAGLTLTPGTTLEMFGGSNFAINHPITVSGDATFRVDSAATVTISSMILGAGTVEVTGDFFSGGTLVLANSNTYTGGTIIDFGTLEIAAMHGAGTGGITFAPIADPRLLIDRGMSRSMLK